MRALRYLLITCLVVTPAFAGSVATKDPFVKEEQQQREARRAEIREREEKADLAREIQQQREVEHPEMMYDDHDDDLEE